MRHATPIPIPEPDFILICHASLWLCPADRPAFWSGVAAQLSEQELGPGAITRAVYAAFATYYRPIEIPDEPDQLRKLTYGERKLEKKFEEIFDGDGAPRGRRQRSDAR